MAIIALTLSLSQVLRGDRGPCPPCPTDADHVLVRNGTYTRHVQDGRGVSVLTIQRYRCHTCAITYSALPYDCRPYTANTWALVRDASDRPILRAAVAAMWTYSLPETRIFWKRALRRRTNLFKWTNGSDPMTYQMDGRRGS